MTHDPEILVMTTIACQLDRLDDDARQRVLVWAIERFHPQLWGDK